MIRFDNAAPADSARERKLVLFCVGGFALLALAGYGFNIYDLWVVLRQDFLSYVLIDRDYSNYWIAGRLVRSGEHLDLFSWPTYFPHMRDTFGPNTPLRNWSYPPHYLLFISWLGFVSFHAGLVVFLGGTLALFLFAVNVFRREYAPTSDLRVLSLALAGYVLMMLAFSQNGFMSAAFLLLGLAWMRRRPALAGLAFACLTVKPQLGLLIPVLLVFDRNWAAVLWSAVFTALLVALSAAVYGLESWGAYLGETAGYQRAIMLEATGNFIDMMPTVLGSMRAWSFSASSAVQAQLPVTLAGFAAVVWLLYRERRPLRRVFAVTCGTFLVTPYAFNYDMGALCVCAALLAGEPSAAPRGAFFAFSIALVAAIAGAVAHLGRVDLPLTPLVLAAGLGVVIASVRSVPAGQPETPASVPSRS
jgi:hypothetical protein